MEKTRVHELFMALDKNDGIYKRSELEEALTLREEITPHLLRVLKQIANDPVAYVAEDHYANVYSVSLLAHFQEPAAHLPIISAFCIPDNQRRTLWGDMVTDTLPALLFLTCNGRFAAIKELVRNREADDYVRNAAAEALTYGVARGMVERQEVIEFLTGLFTGTEAEEGSYFWSDIACSLADLHPQESLETIRQAYTEGLVFSGIVSLQEIEEDSRRNREETFLRLRTEVDRRIPADIHGYISWFSCFKKKDDMVGLSTFKDVGRARQNKKKTNRAKNKLAKKNRKKNRR